MNNKILWHEVVLFLLMVYLVSWKIFYRNVSFDVSLLWWALGVIVGFIFIFLDRFVYSLFTHTTEPLSIKIRELFRQRKVFEAVSILINERREQRELVMRSFLFVAVWVILAFFTMTSSLNTFARGLMLGIGTHLIFDLSTDFVSDKPRFDLWFWQIKRDFGKDEKTWFFGFAVLFYILLAIGL